MSTEEQKTEAGKFIIRTYNEEEWEELVDVEHPPRGRCGCGREFVFQGHGGVNMVFSESLQGLVPKCPGCGTTVSQPQVVAHCSITLRFTEDRLVDAFCVTCALGFIVQPFGSTLNTAINKKGEVSAKCPRCGHLRALPPEQGFYPCINCNKPLRKTEAVFCELPTCPEEDEEGCTKRSQENEC
jgi:hypothetical protein